MIKAYALILALVLGLFAWWLKDRAFVGRHKDMLENFDHAQPQASSNDKPTPGNAPTGQSAASAVTATTGESENAESEANLGEPEAGGMGAALKKIRENKEGQNKRLQDALDQ